MVKLTKPMTVHRPTRWGLLLLLVLAVGFGCWLFPRLYTGLHIHRPIGGEVLVVEGWITDQALDQAVTLFEQGGYSHIYTTGVDMELGLQLLPFQSWADLAAARLKAESIDPARITAVPGGHNPRHRTRAAAAALASYLGRLDQPPRTLDLFTEGVHARRSWSTYKDQLGPGFEVGIYAVDAPSFNQSDWWRCSEGVKSVITEWIAVLFEG